MFAAFYSVTAPVETLVRVAQSFSPRVEVSGRLVLCDLHGVERLFGGPRDVAEHIRRALARAGGSAALDGCRADAASPTARRCPAWWPASRALTHGGVAAGARASGCHGGGHGHRGPRGPRAGAGRHQAADHDELHPGTHIGDHRRPPQQPHLAVAQRDEGMVAHDKQTYRLHSQLPVAIPSHPATCAGTRRFGENENQLLSRAPSTSTCECVASRRLT